MIMLNDKEDKIIFQREIKGGFPIFKAVPPITYGEEGEIILRDDQGSPTRTYYLYAKINGAWRLIGSVT